jgi:hypothetical protein
VFSPALHARPGAYDPIVDTSEESQRDFYQAWELEAMDFLDKHRSQLPHITRNLWWKIVKEVSLTLHQAGVGVTLIKSFGRRATYEARRSLMVTVVITNILPIILLALGQDGLILAQGIIAANVFAGWITAFPFEAVVPPLHLTIVGSKNYVLNGLTYGFQDYNTALRLRKALLGMTRRAHVVTLMDRRIMQEVESDRNNRWIGVSKTSSKDRGLLGQTVDLEELERIAKKTALGPRLLEELKYGRIRKDLYALEVWQIILSEEQTKNELKNLLRQRLPNKADPEVVRYARYMAESRDIKKQLAFAEESLLAALKEAKKGSSAEEQKKLNAIAGEVMALSQAITKSIANVETVILVSMVKKEKSNLMMRHLLDLAHSARGRYIEATKYAAEFRYDRLVTIEQIRRKLEIGEVPPVANTRSRTLAKAKQSCTVALRNVSLKRLHQTAR